MASPLLHMTLKIKPAKVMKTPRGIISKPLLSFLAASMILFLNSFDAVSVDNMDGHSTLS